ncbi:ribose-phosphate pyrophosphokinase [Haliea sp. E1-2-M8]|uniref:ribose-phosphate diphosphokinase n=1 Tax=Haliea sp. E1-2-M8 TaxID=3064706 RepID=UPI0027276A08|nr:ribose-phosphate pyrophosphokinase [Haliea sp. E1-2-M8]MDO8860758.1 ribose-phosphate pyrophosphokinase [Haliea sp. E1-2-M8]
MSKPDPVLFSLRSGADFAGRVADLLGIPLGTHEERDFEDGEHKIRPLESVRQRDVYVVQSLYGDKQLSLNDRLVRLLFMLGCFRENGAASVTAVIPYLCYARKERKTKPRDPVTSRYLAQLLEAMGVDQVVTMDVHSRAAFDNAFRCRTVHLSAHDAFIKYCLAGLGEEQITVASPDIGGVKRAELFRQALERRLGRPVASAFMEKHRSSGKLSGATVVGAVSGRRVLIVDDLVASGSTLQRAAEAFRAQGASQVDAIASHGVFGPGAESALATPPLNHLLVSDSLPAALQPQSLRQNKIVTVTVAPLIGEAIRRLHQGGSLAALDLAED